MAINKGLSGAATTMADSEAAADDSRLSLNPNDERWASQIEDWEDGMEYTVTLTIRQTSPGEFVVQEMSSGEATEESAPEETEAGEESEAPAAATAPQATRGITNPAVVAMMGRNK